MGFMVARWALLSALILGVCGCFLAVGREVGLRLYDNVLPKLGGADEGSWDWQGQWNCGLGWLRYELGRRDRRRLLPPLLPFIPLG